MANFDEIAEYGLGQLLTKRLTTPGGAVAPTVAPELFPCLTLENDRPEWGFLKGEKLGGAAIDVNPVAAQFSIVQLFLPATSRDIVVVKQIRNRGTVAFNIAQGVGIGGGLGAFTANLGTGSRDFRWLNPLSDSLIIERTNNVAQPTVHRVLCQLVTVAGMTYDSPIVIAPGTALMLYTTALNVAMVADVSWTSRTAQVGELV